MKIALVSVTKQGNLIAEKIKSFINADFYSKDNTENFNIIKLSKNLMEEYEGIIYISSTGIAVRAIAPHLKGKDKDPAVLVVDCTGKFVISLLSGHIGGANELAVEIGKIIGAQPIITTATDNLGIEAPDVIGRENKLIIDDLKKAKEIAALLVEGKKVGFIDFDNIISVPCGYVKNIEDVEGIVYITNKIDKGVTNNKLLKLIRKNIVLGIGCRKNYDSSKLKEKVLKLLDENNIDYRAVKAISTVEVKKNEKAILDLVNYFQCDFKVCTLDEIKVVQHNYKGSDFVEKNIGVRAVCEPCVELYGAELITGKLSCEGMTLCIGEKLEG